MLLHFVVPIMQHVNILWFAFYRDLNT